MAQLNGVQYQHPPIIIVHFILGSKILKMTATDSGTIGGREFVDLRNIYAADFHSMHGCAQFLLEECTADRS